MSFSWTSMRQMAMVSVGASRSYLRGERTPFTRYVGGKPALRWMSLAPCWTPAVRSRFRSSWVMPGRSVPSLLSDRDQADLVAVGNAERSPGGLVDRDLAALARRAREHRDEVRRGVA